MGMTSVFWFLSEGEFQLYFLTVLGMLVIPGPAILYIVARSLEQGFGAGLASAAGLAVGGAFHVTLITVGLSHFITSNPQTFNLIKISGALVLLLMGLSKLFKKSQEEISHVSRRGYLKVFYQGAIVEILNPKVIVFYLALLPQFVRPEFGAVPKQMALLGFFYIFCGLFTDTGYCLLSYQLRRIFENQKNFLFWSQKISGIVFLCIGGLALAS